MTTDALMTPDERDFRGQLNSVQLNIVTFVNVARALATQSPDGNVFMRDNSVASEHQGTHRLQTTCRQGQALNWIIVALDGQQRPDRTWPPMPKINNVVFLDRERDDVAGHLICTQLAVYGGSDKQRSPWTPVYYYWAGIVIPTLEPGIYPYRLLVELPYPGSSTASPAALHLNFDGPSLNVIPIDSRRPAVEAEDPAP
jgi:hypothetical protein